LPSLAQWTFWRCQEEEEEEETPRVF
jgi:hypothetical protein